MFEYFVTNNYLLRAKAAQKYTRTRDALRYADSSGWSVRVAIAVMFIRITIIICITITSSTIDITIVITNRNKLDKLYESQ